MRDNQKYLYVELAIPRTSELYQRIQADIVATGLPASNVLVVRLSDAYAGRALALPQPPAIIEQEPEPEPAVDMAQNAAAFLDNDSFF